MRGFRYKGQKTLPNPLTVLDLRLVGVVGNPAERVVRFRRGVERTVRSASLESGAGGSGDVVDNLPNGEYSPQLGVLCVVHEILPPVRTMSTMMYMFLE